MFQKVDACFGNVTQTIACTPYVLFFVTVYEVELLSESTCSTLFVKIKFKKPKILSVFSSFLLVLSREILHNNHLEVEFFTCLLDQLLGKKTESKINI